KLAPSLEVPEADTTLVVTEGAAAVGRNREAIEVASVIVEAADLTAGLQVPEAEVVVGAVRKNAPAVGGESDRVEGALALASLEAVDLRTGVEVPEAHRPVPRSRGGAAALRADRDRPDGIPMAGEAADFRPRVEVPEVEVLVRPRPPLLRCGEER